MAGPSVLDIIEAEVETHGRDAESLRCAAWYVLEAYPDTTSAQFADAAAQLDGITRKSAINRWNEAMANLEIANG